LIDNVFIIVDANAVIHIFLLQVKTLRTVSHSEKCFPDWSLTTFTDWQRRT